MAGKEALAYSLTFRHPERTLTVRRGQRRPRERPEAPREGSRPSNFDKSAKRNLKRFDSVDALAQGFGHLMLKPILTSSSSARYVVWKKAAFIPRLAGTLALHAGGAFQSGLWV